MRLQLKTGVVPLSDLAKFHGLFQIQGLPIQQQLWLALINKCSYTLFQGLQTFTSQPKG